MKTSASNTRTALWLTTLLLVVMATAAVAKDDEHGYLGVMLQNVSGSMAKALQLKEGEGVLINEVVEDSPAEAAGLEDGDVILSFDGKSIDDYGDLTKAVRATKPGDKVEIEILHDGKRQTKKVKMGEGKGNVFSYRIETDGDDPKVEFFGEGDGHGNVWIDEGDDGEHEVIIMSGDHKGMKWFEGDEGMRELHLEHMFPGGDRGFMGVELDDLNEQLGEYFGVDDGEGALISKVNDDSPAAAAGLRAGDVILSIDDEDVADAGDVHAAMAGTEPGQEVEVAIMRKGKKKTMKVTLGEGPENAFAPMMMKHFDRDFKVKVPRAPRRIREIHRLHDGDEDLDEVRVELDRLREELKELKHELKKEMKK